MKSFCNAKAPYNFSVKKLPQLILWVLEDLRNLGLMTLLSQLCFEQLSVVKCEKNYYVMFQFRPIYGVVVFQKVDHEGWCKPKCNMTMTDMVCNEIYCSSGS